MEAIVTHVAASYLLARCQQEKILVHQDAAEFIVKECRKGDIVNIHALEDTGRGPKARSATWVSSPVATQLAEFTGVVTTINADKMFAFVKPDEGDIDIFCHVTDFADYQDTSATFNGLSRGDRVRGCWSTTSRGRRGQYVAAEL